MSRTEDELLVIELKMFALTSLLFSKNMLIYEPECLKQSEIRIVNKRLEGEFDINCSQK